ncbi:DUF6716 putative glycosyltransferase [Ensifer sp. 22460]|uniref:DUF6716 putative glycosyltransferase n=1 Tax=Ensifer sp. 22460 TaxID=3453922 RepID=UPI003F87A439
MSEFNTKRSLRTSLPAKQQKALLVYSTDSYVGFCSIIYDHLTSAHFEIEIIEVVKEHSSVGLSDTQRIKWAVSFPKSNVRFATDETLVEEIIASCPDFLFLGIPGRKVFRVCNKLDRAAELNSSMVITTGFPGLQYYMRFTGLYWRAFVDRLLFIDASHYRQATKRLAWTPLRTANCVLFGTPRVRNIPTRDTSIDRRYIAFFEQNEVPSSKSQRFELARQLALLADAHPQKTLLVIARSGPGETSNHHGRESMRIDRILLEREGRNVDVFNGDWMTIADDIEFAVSVSSTALLEANLLQIPAFSLRIGARDGSRFDAFQFFQEIGFGRTLEQLTSPCALEPVQSSAEFLVPYDPTSLLKVLSPRTRQRRPLGRGEILLRHVCVAIAKAFDWAFRLRERYPIARNHKR